MSKLKQNSVKLVEVGARDGLQNEKTNLATDVKFEYIKRLTETGLKNIEVTSFVSPKAIPQMGDSKELYQRVVRELNPDLNYPCLVPNMKGYEAAKSVGIKEIALFSATSNEFTKKNINCTVEESFQRMTDVATEAKKDGVRLRGYISTAFGCPYVGHMPVEALDNVLEHFFNLGVYEVSIGDTIGVANPNQVDEYLKALRDKYDFNKIAMHFHDTRGMAVANILKSLENDIFIYDASSGGLGGCPYAKGATGNVATEDVLYLFNSYGLEHGVDLEKLVQASRYILNQINKETPSKYLTTLFKRDEK